VFALIPRQQLLTQHQVQPVGESQIVIGAGLLQLLLKIAGHAVQLQVTQVVQSLSAHGGSLVLSVEVFWTSDVHVVLRQLDRQWQFFLQLVAVAGQDGADLFQAGQALPVGELAAVV